jgi:hypothetical protein
MAGGAMVVMAGSASGRSRSTRFLAERFKEWS